MTIRRGTHIIHTVQPGDTVYGLAVRYESEVDAITQANALYPPFTDMYSLTPGQVLVIPKPLPTETLTLYVIQYGNTIGQLSQRFTTPIDPLSGINPTIHNPNFILPNQQIELPVFIYEVDTGDTLASISERTGIPIEAIMRANMNRLGVNQDVIYEGVRLIIPLPVSQNIVVTLPLPGTTVRDGSIIEGYARTFEANVLFRLIDDSGQVVTEETFTTARYAAPSYGNFRDNIPFDRQPTTDSGELQVYTRSAQDGSIQDLVQIRVLFP
ncbi:LysM peptidoglycan-binding domain-containing protein [Alkalibacillus aidingensis]|uniref:LysM peptidoglycan-binding domain-containing protein n=1 Tax=Alkalibacillus aidingensis TaxID=2747607 RepID=UPI0016613C70|nr:LysM peptidoglycan-binding domain-containing protein [Alkalibacillus aidingensis]